MAPAGKQPPLTACQIKPVCIDAQTCGRVATKSNSYTFQKDGIWYFSSRVPADLWRHYWTGRIAYSLRTKSIRDARVRAMSDAAKLDRHWHILRISSDDLPGKHLLTDAVQEPVAEPAADEHSLKDAVAVYLRLKGHDRPPTFEAAVRRSCGYLIDCCGMKSLKDYLRLMLPSSVITCLLRGLMEPLWQGYLGQSGQL